MKKSKDFQRKIDTERVYRVINRVDMGKRMLYILMKFKNSKDKEKF